MNFEMARESTDRQTGQGFGTTGINLGGREMTPEQQAAYIVAQATAANIEMESMRAANWMREMQGKTIAYGEEEFIALIDRYGIHHNAVISAFGG